MARGAQSSSEQILRLRDVEGRGKWGDVPDACAPAALRTP